MKILFVVANNFPESGACTSLLNNMFLQGRLIDWAGSIDVLALKDCFPPQKKTLFNGVTVYNSVFPSRVSQKEYISMIKKHPLKAINGLKNKVLYKLDSNEINENDVKSIERDLKKIGADKYDVIVAVMGSFTAACAAMRFKKINSHLKLVVYQVDPCLSNEVCPDSTREERRAFEKELYETADSIINTPILIEESKSVYPEEIIRKMVPMEFPNVVHVEADLPKTTEKIRCLFTGNIYGDFRDPTYTLELFERLKGSVQFEMIGAVDAETKSKLDSHNVIYHGSKKLNETKEELKKADVLVNIGNRMLNQVPSKIFEYISYGKPIINVCKSRECPTQLYFSKHLYALNLFEEEALLDEQAEKLGEFIQNNYGSRMNCDEITKLYETCTPQYCATQMKSIFENLI